MYKTINSVLILLLASLVYGKVEVCDQKPRTATVDEPSENADLFRLTLDTKDSENKFLPDQTYVLILKTQNESRPFRWFMITVDDPDSVNSAGDYRTDVDVGSLKTLPEDSQSRYSERCRNTVENADLSDKRSIEIHWISPKKSKNKQKIRIRAMVAENQETWYIGDYLNMTLTKNTNHPSDTPPYEPVEVCNLCSEARYEVTFYGKWSRVWHPRHYPSKPDENGYSHMIGASHNMDFSLWQQGTGASAGLKLLAEETNVTVIEREIINATAGLGARTLIRGMRRHHPNMFEPSHSLFRVDRNHHLFSIAIGMRPSPDWFLGTSRFELCTEHGWLEYHKMPLYPWDAGTTDGISYESPKVMTQPTGNVERVAVGSFDSASPFYQMNLNDLKAFAYLEVRRLDVFPLVGADCVQGEPSENIQEGQFEGEVVEESQPSPLVFELKAHDHKDPCHGRWGEWSPCIPDNGACGIGTQVRSRERLEFYYNVQDTNNLADKSSRVCDGNQETSQTQDCYLECF